ncbi:MAG TPA: hypothetical protein PLA50_16495 [Bacteroidia bacterium]|nr:hypothetical protein [Bacteroidia bacterium]
MIYWQTDSDGLLASGPHEAPLSRGGGVHLLPAGAVTDPPPPDDGESAIAWTGAAWERRPLPEPADPKPPVVVTPRQIRLALLSRGITPSMIEDALVGNEAALIEWEYASHIRRDHSLVATLGSAFSVSESDLDSLFESASTL